MDLFRLSWYNRNMNNIRNLRISAGLKQKDIAAYIGCSTKLVSCWETGANNPQIVDLIKLADYFDVSVDYLIGRVDDFGDTGKVPKISDDKIMLLKQYGKLSEANRGKVFEYIDFLCFRFKNGRTDAE